MAQIVDPEEREIEALHKLSTFDGADVLDIGCGEGRTSRRIARTAGSVLGIDPDATKIETAASVRVPEPTCDLRFRVADATHCDLPTAGFDTVVFSRSL